MFFENEEKGKNRSMFFDFFFSYIQDVYDINVRIYHFLVLKVYFLTNEKQKIFIVFQRLKKDEMPTRNKIICIVLVLYDIFSEFFFENISMLKMKLMMPNI